MNAKHTPLEVAPDITGQDVLFNPDQDILTPIVSPSAGRAVMWVDCTPHDEMNGFADEVVRAVNAHDDLVELAEGVITLVETRFPSQAEFFKGLGMVEKAARAALAKAKG